MKITCDVIEDLIPLYVDDVASGDSRVLIEEHLKECENCRKTLADMREGIGIAPVKENPGQDDKLIILRLKKKIMRRIAAVIAVAAVLVGIVCVWNYLYYDFNVYVDYEDSGVYVENGLLFAPLDLGGQSSCLTVDGTVQFFYVLHSPFNHKESPLNDERKNFKIIQDMNAPWPEYAEAIITDAERAEQLREEGVTNFSFMPVPPTDTRVERLYYLAKDQKKTVDAAYKAFSRGDNEEADRLFKLAEENSVLLWERE